MKLFEIKDPLADDPDYDPNDQVKQQAIWYIWNQLFCKYADTLIQFNWNDNAKEVINTRNKIIKHTKLWEKVPKCAFMYAQHILRGRFPAGEPAIGTNPAYKEQYEHDFNCKI